MRGQLLIQEQTFQTVLHYDVFKRINAQTGESEHLCLHKLVCF